MTEHFVIVFTSMVVLGLCALALLVLIVGMMREGWK